MGTRTENTIFRSGVSSGGRSLKKNMKIQILTSEYPTAKPSYDTPIVHYFTREWKAMGHWVEVIHFRSVFPMPFYWIAKLFLPIIKRITGTDFIPTERLTLMTDSYLDKVHIKSIPIFKWFPHMTYSESVINTHVKQIVSDNKNKNFAPDIIIGHFYNPQIVVINKLIKHYPSAKSCVVLHENPLIIKNKYPNQYEKLLKSVDIWGFRYNAMRSRFIELYGNSYHTFICHSGVPEEYIDDSATRRIIKKTDPKYCYAGMLIPLKNVDISIRSLNAIHPQKDFTFNIIGDGMEKSNLEQIIDELELQDNVRFHGKMNRAKVQGIIADSDYFIMVSEPEAFGLVYLEAMAKGCITIGTKKQGIDGVIIDGYNGFLCQPRSIEDLTATLIKIKNMAHEELLEISNNAILTAKNMTDNHVAFNYLKTIQDFIK